MSETGTEYATTWDGLPIAAETPHGSTIVVRRPSAVDGHFDYLLLHRAHHGPDYDGHWGWTPPAGSRQPGEAVLPAAERELAEEAGITGAWLSPVDLSDTWALFRADVPADAQVTLIDVEHDAYRWVDPVTVGRMCRPIAVARNAIGVDVIPAATLSFTPATPADRDTVTAWLAEPHSTERDTTVLADRYAALLDGDGAFIVHANGRPAGVAEHRPVPDAYAALAGDGPVVGVDVGFGDAHWSGRGLGAGLVWDFLRRVVLPAHPGVRTVVTWVPADWRQAPRMLAKAGFTAAGSADGHRVFTLDVGHWFGK